MDRESIGKTVIAVQGQNNLLVGPSSARVAIVFSSQPVASRIVPLGNNPLLSSTDERIVAYLSGGTHYYLEFRVEIWGDIVTQQWHTFPLTSNCPISILEVFDRSKDARLS